MEKKKRKRLTPDEQKERLNKFDEESKSLDEQLKHLRDIRASGQEAAFKEEYESMLKGNAALIRRLLTSLKYNLSTRDIYALSTLMSQQREVINDLRCISDLSQQVVMVQDQVLNPLVSNATQLLTEIYYQLRKLITETAIPKQTQFALGHLDSLVKNMAVGLQQCNVESKEKLNYILLGEQQQPVKKKRKSI